MDASKIVDQYYEDAGKMSEYNEWDIQDLITELVMSGQGELELYKSCEDMSEEEFKDMWDGIQALRKAVLAALGIKDNDK
jgi:hypothetical protein